MNGLMMDDYPLTLSTIFRRGETLFRRREIVTRLPDRSLHRYTFADFAGRARRLAAALRGLGIRPGDPIAPDSQFTPLAGGERYLAKAWDDRVRLAVMVLAVVLAAPPAHAQELAPGKIDPDGYDLAKLRAALPEYFHPTGGNGRVQPADLPDVFGPGAVLRVGNVNMKVTNNAAANEYLTRSYRDGWKL